MIGVFFQGFILGLSLILVIGAQNAFVLRQGLRGEHVFAVALTCAVSDAILVAVGVGGFGAIVAAAPWLTTWLTWGGAIFLIIYGALSMYRALRSSEILDPATNEEAGLISVLTTVLVLTWANPHVYLDTVVLLGSVSTGFGDQAVLFGAGAAVASFAFFFSLAYGAAILRPIFSNPFSWRVLDAAVGLIMWLIAYKLLFGMG